MNQANALTEGAFIPILPFVEWRNPLGKMVPIIRGVVGAIEDLHPVDVAILLLSDLECVSRTSLGALNGECRIAAENKGLDVLRTNDLM